jgi:hypothetical protein
MFKGKGEIIFLAILVIIISAVLSGFGSYFFLSQKLLKSPAQEVLLDRDGDDVSKPAIVDVVTEADSSLEQEGSSGNQIKIEDMGADTQEAAKNLGKFYFYLESGEYDQAAELVDWQYADKELLESLYGITSGLDDRAAILEEICSQEEVKTKIRILSVKEPTAAENVFFFRVNYLEEDGQVYVSSSHVAGQFINETEFIIEVAKKGDKFLVRTLPGMFIIG